MSVSFLFGSLAITVMTIKNEEEEDEPPRRSSRQSGRARSQRGQKNYRPKDFLEVDEDDDLDFEFLDLK